MESLFVEVNGLLQSVNDESNMVRAAQSQEWDMLQAQGILPADGNVVAFNAGQQFGLEYHFSGDIAGVTVDPSLGLDPGKLVYVQDSPGLNNLDWSNSIDQSLQTVVNGNLGTVVKLPRGDIAHFRPDHVFNGEGILFKNVTGFPINLTSLPTYPRYACSTDNLQDNSCHLNDPTVYIVIIER